MTGNIKISFHWAAISILKYWWQYIDNRLIQQYQYWFLKNCNINININIENWIDLYPCIEMPNNNIQFDCIVFICCRTLIGQKCQFTPRSPSGWDGVWRVSFGSGFQSFDFDFSNGPPLRTRDIAGKICFLFGG